MVLTACVLSLGGHGCTPAPKTEPARKPRLVIHDEIRDLVAARGRTLSLKDTVGLERTWEVLANAYKKHRHRPFWSNGRQPRRQALQLLEAIRRTEESGLDPAVYDLERLDRLVAQAARSSGPAESLRVRTLARFDVLATYAYLRVAEHLWEGRLPRAMLDRDWVRDTLLSGGPERLLHALGRDPTSYFAELEPRHEGYAHLRAALARYREIAATGGWLEIPAGPPLKLGDRGPRVAALVRRLAMTGDLATPPADTVFDRGLEQAVGDLQTRLGIPRSGILGEATRAVLSVPVERRIRQMELNLERWRWLPDTLGRSRVEINIPAYRLELFREGRVVRPMRVVVGRRKSPTPVFSDRITYVEVNPTWTLPGSIVSQEIVPALARQRNYLEKNHMRVISIATAKRDTVEPRRVPWKDAGSDSFPYLVIQDAGPENPLGQIKLMCPNEYDVYLHDTPQRSRFGVAVRDYSHGCVRLEHAIELADSLLNGTRDVRVPVDSLVAVGAWKRVSLPESVPVHFLYWTAWSDSSGRVHFRDDVYGLDERLDTALRDRADAAFALNPDVAVSPFWMAAEARAKAAAARAQAVRSQRKRE